MKEDLERATREISTKRSQFIAFSSNLEEGVMMESMQQQKLEDMMMKNMQKQKLLSETAVEPVAGL